ncbi:MAG: aminopeptidase P N-terminal domain-containing protein [Gemmatimonadaceae bacterium]|nr:aminopeptidase P N-terminal domain-containing protein [Gemmatimonadaceae bacterium]
MRRRAPVIVLGALLLAGRSLPGQVPVAEYAARRAALGAMTGDGVTVVLGRGEPAHDFETFSQSPDLRYLTGWTQPNAALVLVRTNGAQRELLFVAPRSAAEEVWTGPRPSLADAARMAGLPVRDVREFTATCDSLLAAGNAMRIVGEFRGAATAAGESVTNDRVFLDALAQRHPGARVSQDERSLLLLRARKSAAEIALLRSAIAITVQAHEDVMRMVTPGWNEFEVQALVEYTFRRNGAERPGFTSITGSADNTTTLHYWQNDRPMRDGELLLMDIGASYAGYSADVTRTVPLSGRFTAPQRAIYELVRRAQVAGEQATKIGAPLNAPNEAASEVLARGLVSLGLMESPTATYDCDSTGQRTCRQLGLYYMHGLGHGIGLEVHDPDIAYFSTWSEGSVMTIEPGIYVRRNLAEVLPDTPRNRALLARLQPALATYAGIGVRIEDDYLLTAAGLEWLSKAPREVAEVEAAMQAPRASAPRPRDPALVERYRRALP